MKLAGTKWWDGYTNQENVIIEDIDAGSVAGAEMVGLYKQWLDRYPFAAEVKGSSFVIRPRRLVITSNFHPAEVFKPADIDPIWRRIDVYKKASLESEIVRVTEKGTFN